MVIYSPEWMNLKSPRQQLAQRMTIVISLPSPIAPEVLQNVGSDWNVRWPRLY